MPDEHKAHHIDGPVSRSATLVSWTRELNLAGLGFNLLFTGHRSGLS